MHRLKVHRPLRVPAKAQAQGAQAPPGQACSQVPAHVQQGAQALPGQACLQVPARHRLKVHRPFRLRRARRCPHTQSRCTGPSRSGVPAGARKCSRCHRSSGPCCSTYHRGCYLFICQASQVQQMPQVLSPYCSTDRRGSCARRPRFSRCRRFSSGQVPIAAQTTVGLVPGVQVQQMPQVLRSLLQHGPPWVYCQASQVQQSAAQTPWVLCRAFQVQ